MGRFIRLSLVFLLILSLESVAGWQPSFAQSDGGYEYFKQTGHSVSGPFLAKYRSVPNSLQLYGYPITEAFTSNTGLEVQYFQKARFELSDDQVQLSNLGQFMHKAGQAEASFDGTTACQVVAPTPFQACYAFLEFFDQNGGARQFGLPISNAEQHGDLIVQYFERARFEWRPDQRVGQRVALTDLGAQYFYAIGENQAQLLPVPENNTINGQDTSLVDQGILNLRVRGYPHKAVAGQQGAQKVYVIVQDQRLMPVPNAQVTLLVTLPDGRQNRYIIPTLTNERGVVQFQFNYQTGTTGPVKVQITATYQNLKGQTSTSFRAWW
jgi:hypothetical protein